MLLGEFIRRSAQIPGRWHRTSARRSAMISSSPRFNMIEFIVMIFVCRARLWQARSMVYLFATAV